MVSAQTLDEQFKKADDELNRVYKELRSKLNEQQKAELKKLQMAWLKEVYKVADLPREPQQYLTPAEQRQQFLIKATWERVGVLKKIFEQVAGMNLDQHDFHKADEELNIAYKKLRATLSKEETDNLKKEQLRWIKSLNTVENDLSSKILLTRARALEFQNGAINTNADNDKAWAQACQTEESKYAASFGLRPTYQSCIYNPANLVAEAENEKYRAISIADSNKIYVFDKKSKLLLGDVAVWSALYEGSAEQIKFTGCGRYIVAAKSGYKGGDFSFYHIPSMLPVFFTNSYRELAHYPLFSFSNYSGIAISRSDNLEQTKDFLFEDVVSMSKRDYKNDELGLSFIANFPNTASRIGQFYLFHDYGLAANPKFVADVNIASHGTSNASDVEYAKSFKFYKRPNRQIEDIALNGDNFLLMERQGEFHTNLELNLGRLKLSRVGETSAQMLNNPTAFDIEDLSLYGKKLEEKKIFVKLGGLNCEIEQKEDSSIANLSFENNNKKVVIPPHGNHSFGELFQMARHHKGPKPILAAYWMRQDKAGNNYTLNLLNTASAKSIYEGSNNRPGRYFSEIRRYWYDLASGDVWISEPGGAKLINNKYVTQSGFLNLIDGATGEIKKKLPCEQLFEVFAVGKSHLVGLPRMDEQRFEVWQMEPFLKLFEVIWDDDLSLSFFCTDGFYSTASKTTNKMAVRSYDRAYPFEQFDLRLNRPDIVLERLGAPDEAIAIAKQLREKRLKRMGVTEEMLQPDFHLPEIEILGDLPSSTADSELALKIKASDSKYPLDRLRVYVNNVPVNGKEGELLRDAKSQSLERPIPLKLAAGRNKIQVSVLNSAGAESLYANAEVQCTAPRPKPTLYAVAMGVSEYANPEWNLKYAAKDATDILSRIHSQSGSSYGEVKELLLTDREVTKENLAKIREFLSKATVDDTVLMFVAGHGLLDSKYDYYFGTSDIDFENPSGKGIAFEEFDDLLADLPCLKKSLLIDTCHAGELDEDEKKALAAAQSAPTGQQVAMHPVGARGMSIKPVEGARGKSEWYDRLQGLFVDLRRGSGSTILSSSAGAEYALESSEQKNGLFTYAVLEALDGKEGSDANKDGSVTMSELAEYVKSRVATLTNNKQSPNVRRVNLEADFALAK
jgi:uncharacterized protein YecT (DUF1311 family)